MKIKLADNFSLACPNPKHIPPLPPNHHRPSPTPTHHRTTPDLCTATERRKKGSTVSVLCTATERKNTPLLPPCRPPSSPPSVATTTVAAACRRAVTGEVATVTACHLFNRVVDTVVDRVCEARGKKSVVVRKAKMLVL
ncbi:hypothetical protein PIB30_008980 [Stylosanthes scabra]|uniref:Uncharacterized protein n=1 Tax=Stylosanthes scabra TaxID=79078 RepID=A0ABU6S4Z7_9FABA|nr:hypothetical protein [Stylosanthes scabra]